MIILNIQGSNTSVNIYQLINIRVFMNTPQHKKQINLLIFNIFIANQRLLKKLKDPACLTNIGISVMIFSVKSPRS